MDNIFSDIVLTSRDENLRAGNFVRAVRLRIRLRAQQTQISTAMWLSQAHRAGPFA